MQCPNCASEIAAGKRFCTQCGSPAPLACPSCGGVNAAGARFCGDCGAKLDGAAGAVPKAARPQEAAAPSVAERRQLTVMFCDLVGSTELASRLDPEVTREVIAGYRSCVAQIVGEFEGFVAQYLGDGVVAYFGYPSAHEDDAERTVRAALAVVAAVQKLKPHAGVALQARIGVASGLVVVGEQLGAEASRERAAVGETPNLAARLQALAAPNEVLISESTRRLLGRLFDLRELPKVTVKGVTEPLTAYAVLGPSSIASRFDALRVSGPTPLVGRAEEIDLLLRRWEQAKLGEGRVVLLAGEAGIGKSCIAESLLTRLEGEPHARLRYFCSPHHTHSPLHPFITQIERAAGFEPGSSAGAKLDKLATLLKPAARNLPQELALIAELLAVPLDGRYPAVEVGPQQKREMTLAALLDQLDGLAAQRPVLILFEDAHWIDPTSFDLLDQTVARAADLPVLLVITCRPDLQPAWVGQPHVTMLPLSRLGRRDSAGIIGGVTKGKALPNEVVAQILERTDGVPLFIEELTSTLLESGVLRETAESYTLDGPLPPLAIPTTLQASLVARLDRLATVKNVAQIGAVIGREFSHELIGAVAALSSADLDAALERLTASGLISRRGTPPAAAYSFKHALIQDAAYSTLLRGQRKVFHARITKVLEERFPETVKTQPEILAHHYAQADLPDQAIDYWLSAGERSVMRSAYVEAVEHLTQGIELTKLLPASPERGRKELRLHLALGPAVTACKGLSAPETVQVYSRAHDLLGNGGTLAEQMIVLSGLWNGHWGRAEHSAALEVAKECLAFAEGHEHVEASALANRMTGLTLCTMGAFVEARRHLEQTLGLCSDSEGMRTLSAISYAYDDRVIALSYLARVLWPLGYPEQAVAAATQAVARARGLGHAITTAQALHAEVLLAAFGNDPQRAAIHADGFVTHCVEHSIANFEHWARLYQGAIFASQGEPLHGIEVMRNAIAAADTMNSKVFRPLQLGQLARAHASLGQVEVGLGLLDEAIETAEKTGEGFFEAELNRLRGEMCLTVGKKVEAETALQRGLTVARRQQARLWELRAATSLAELWRNQGRGAEARDLLAPVCGWFTEGFDLPDIKNARTLLDELTQPDQRPLASQKT